MASAETRHLELLRRTDVLLSTLLAVIPDADMRKQAQALLSSIDVETHTGASPESGPGPLVEYGDGWAKVHFRRKVTERDRDVLASLQL